MDNVNIRAISKGLQQVAITELNEDLATIHESIQHLREWLQIQPHLKVRLDNQSLLIFLRGCKWSVQLAKEKIDYHHTIKTLIPEAFTNKDPLDPQIQIMLEAGIMYPLPNTDEPNGARILYVDFTVIDYTSIKTMDLLKLCLITTDVLMYNDDHFLISGEKLVVNFAGIPLYFYVQLTPIFLKKVIKCWVMAYPVRIKLFLGFNVPESLARIYSALIKPFISTKLQNRVHLFTTENDKGLYEYIPKALFPEELGGCNGSRLKLAAEFKTKVESCRHWFLEDYKYVTNESLRLTKPQMHNEEFGVEGTFRKLNID